MINRINPRLLYNVLLSEDKHLARRILATLGFIPAKLHLYRLAFSHKSGSINLSGKGDKILKSNNERLEYLGDAILSSIVAEYLYNKYPTADEGFLTKMRSKIVMRKSLNKIADRMGLDVLLDSYNNTNISTSMLGNALEALVGAIYLDLGYRRTKYIVVEKILRSYLNIHDLERKNHNFKSVLLEYCQKNGHDIEYVLKERYKIHKRDRFKIAVVINGDELSNADDFNKKSAEQAASQSALNLLGISNQESTATLQRHS